MKYLILGAGPAGLAFANMKLIQGEDSFIVLESESEAGGLCRSVDVDDAPFDIGGGHFLDVRRPDVNAFLFKFMAEDEWDRYKRNTSLVMGNVVMGQPIEAFIWQLPIDSQVQYLKSIALAGCNVGEPMPEKFTDWIYWKLGSKIAEDYMIPYNKKIFGENPSKVEGESNAEWILMDYFDVVVHIFQKDKRDYYRLEQLWADGKKIEF